MSKKSARKTLSWFCVSFCIFMGLGSVVSVASEGQSLGQLMEPSPSIGPGDMERSRQYAPGEILVKFKPSVTQVRISAINSVFSTSILRTIPQINVRQLKIPTGATVSEMVQKFLSLPEVEFAEPNGVYSTFVVPNDPRYSEQWALSKIEAGSAWDIPKKQGDIIVAITDTGVDLNHPDLVNQVLPGYDFANDDSDPTDDNGHGTHCAGIVAAQINNGIGIAGLSQYAKIMPVKVLVAEGWGYWSWVAEGIIYAVDNGARVISQSLGGDLPSDTVEQAVNYAYSRGSLVVAAAGNDAWDWPSYPAAYDTVVAVAATNENDRIAYYSNYGPYIEVAAPGGETYDLQDPGGILSTMPTYHVTLNDQGFLRDYDFMQGTSMACPYVAGFAALIMARNPDLSNEQVREFMRTGCDDLGAPGWDQYFGYGRINAYSGVDIVPLLFVGDISETVSFPNPFRLGETAQVTIAFPTGIDVIIRVYNVIGQLVRTLDEEGNEIHKNKGEAYWDGRDDNGNRVSSGLYIYVIQMWSGKKYIGKITLIK